MTKLYLLKQDYKRYRQWNQGKSFARTKLIDVLLWGRVYRLPRDVFFRLSFINIERYRTPPYSENRIKRFQHQLKASQTSNSLSLYDSPFDLYQSSNKVKSIFLLFRFGAKEIVAILGCLKELNVEKLSEQSKKFFLNSFKREAWRYLLYVCYWQLGDWFFSREIPQQLTSENLFAQLIDYFIDNDNDDVLQQLGYSEQIIIGVKRYLARNEKDRIEHYLTLKQQVLELKQTSIKKKYYVDCLAFLLGTSNEKLVKDDKLNYQVILSHLLRDWDNDCFEFFNVSDRVKLVQYYCYHDFGQYAKLPTDVMINVCRKSSNRLLFSVYLKLNNRPLYSLTDDYYAAIYDLINAQIHYDKKWMTSVRKKALRLEPKRLFEKIIAIYNNYPPEATTLPTAELKKYILKHLKRAPLSLLCKFTFTEQEFIQQLLPNITIQDWFIVFFCNKHQLPEEKCERVFLQVSQDLRVIELAQKNIALFCQGLNYLEELAYSVLVAFSLKNKIADAKILLKQGFNPEYEKLIVLYDLRTLSTEQKISISEFYRQLATEKLIMLTKWHWLRRFFAVKAFMIPLVPPQLLMDIYYCCNTILIALDIELPNRKAVIRFFASNHDAVSTIKKELKGKKVNEVLIIQKAMLDINLYQALLHLYHHLCEETQPAPGLSKVFDNQLASMLAKIVEAVATATENETRQAHFLLSLYQQQSTSPQEVTTATTKSVLAV